MSVVVKSAEYLDFYFEEPLVRENTFVGAPADRSFTPDFTDARHFFYYYLGLPNGWDAMESWTLWTLLDTLAGFARWWKLKFVVQDKLPKPMWVGHESSIACYWKAWELAFKHLQRVHTGNKFIAPYIDTAFNDCLFMWDSCFILMFGKYGSRAFNFQRTLDNLYSKQHPDGFISREITEWSGQDRFHRYDPASTGPNILAWCEWEYYLNFGDKTRLGRIFPVLLAYHKWCRRLRTWPDGSYHSCGLACGMDNQPRVAAGYSAWTDHSHMAWIDATCQALISARLLILMSKELGKEGHPDIEGCKAEHAKLAKYIQENMWDEERKSFFDRRLAGDRPSLSDTFSIASYWSLLADVVNTEKLPPFVSHLDDPMLFNRPVRTPALAMSHPEYRDSGGYWLGGVWPSTNYMLLRGLTHTQQDDLAADIAHNYHTQVVRLFEKTGTVWENMAPELDASGDPRAGDPAKPDFVGWGGIGPISVLLEYVFGIRPDVPAGTIHWDIRLLDEFGVTDYPFGGSAMLAFNCGARRSVEEEPVVLISSTIPLRVVLYWGKTASTVGGVAPDATERAKPVFKKEIFVEPFR